MDIGTAFGAIGIAATAAFSIWAVNDARKQVRKQVLMQRNVASARLQNDMAWRYLDPTERAQSKEIAKELAEFALLARALHPEWPLDSLRTAAEREALEMAEWLVANGNARWKEELDMEKVRQSLDESKAQKDSVRTRTGEKIWPSFAWCLPALLGFALFLVSFPIDRTIPFGPRLSLAGIFALWFLFVTPITTLVAIVVFLRRERRGQFSRSVKWMVWIAIGVSLLVNAFVLLGMWAAQY